MKIQTNYLNIHKKKYLNDMKVKNDYTRDSKAHVLDPNPQA